MYRAFIEWLGTLTARHAIIVILCASIAVMIVNAVVGFIRIERNGWWRRVVIMALWGSCFAVLLVGCAVLSVFVP